MYTHDRRVTYSEISMKGFADIAQIAEYFQDCSVFQSEVLGMGLTYMNEHHLAWLLASWQIDVDTYPEMGCKVSISDPERKKSCLCTKFQLFFPLNGVRANTVLYFIKIVLHYCTSKMM